MQYKALPWLRVCTFGLGAQSANIWKRDWNVSNAIIKVLVLRNPRTCPTPPETTLVLLGQAGRTPFSNYVIKPDETGVTGAMLTAVAVSLRAV